MRQHQQHDERSGHTKAKTSNTMTFRKGTTMSQTTRDTKVGSKAHGAISNGLGITITKATRHGEGSIGQRAGRNHPNRIHGSEIKANHS